MRDTCMQLLWLQEQAAAAAGAGDAAGGPQAAAAPAERNKLLAPGSNLTAIHLPLRPGCDEVGQKLDHLRPTLLLFLRKLRCLMLTDTVSGEVRRAASLLCRPLQGFGPAHQASTCARGACQAV